MTSINDQPSNIVTYSVTGSKTISGQEYSGLDADALFSITDPRAYQASMNDYDNNNNDYGSPGTQSVTNTSRNNPHNANTTNSRDINSNTTGTTSNNNDKTARVTPVLLDDTPDEPNNDNDEFSDCQEDFGASKPAQDQYLAQLAESTQAAAPFLATVPPPLPPQNISGSNTSSQSDANPNRSVPPPLPGAASTIPTPDAIIAVDDALPPIDINLTNDTYNSQFSPVPQSARSRNNQALDRIIIKKQYHGVAGTWAVDRWGRLIFRPETATQQPEGEGLVPSQSASHVTNVSAVSQGSSHGFASSPSPNLVQPASITTTSANGKIRSRDVERERKWLHMIIHWDEFTTKKEATLKRRIRKGIPSSVRGAVWPLLVHVNEVKANYSPKYYYELLEKPVREADLIQIRKDLPRLMQDHVTFRSPEAGSRTVLCQGQALLYNVLRAYCAHDPVVGYVQGMDSIAAPALLYFPEELTFWYLERLLNSPKYNLREVYTEGFPLSRKYVYIHQRLVQRYIPRLYSLMTETDVQHSGYAFRWYTMRYAQFAPELSYRVLDMYLYEGDKILYRIALALLLQREKDLLSDPDTLLEKLMYIENEHTSHAYKDGDILINTALNIDLTHAHIAKLEKEYLKLEALGQLPM